MGTTVNIRDTILFLTIARNILCESVEDMNLSTEDSEILKTFFLEESTDYEIIHILFEGTIPTSRNDLIMESFYYDKIVQEYGKDYNFIPLSVYNLSSQPLIRRFVIESNILEQGSIEKWKLKLDEESRNRDIISELPDVPPEQKNLLNKKVEYAYAKYVQAVSNRNVIMAKRRGEDSSGYETRSEKAKEDVDIASSQLDVAKNAVKIADQRSKNVPLSVRGSEPLSIGFTSLYRSARNGWAAVRPELAKFLSSPAGQSIGGDMLISLVSFASHRSYLSMVEKAKVVCGGLTGTEKVECNRRYKVSGLQKKIVDLRAGLPYCNSSKNPAKCNIVIRSKIEKTIGELIELKRKE